MLLSMLAGALTGLLTGAGIGGGSLLLLYMTVFQKVPQLEAQGINLLYFLAATPLSLYFHIRAHRVETKGWRSRRCAARFHLPGRLLGRRRHRCRLAAKRIGRRAAVHRLQRTACQGKAGGQTGTRPLKNVWRGRCPNNFARSG